METILGGVVARVIASMNRRHWTSMLVIRGQSDFFLWDFFFPFLFFSAFFFLFLVSVFCQPRNIAVSIVFRLFRRSISKLGRRGFLSVAAKVDGLLRKGSLCTILFFRGGSELVIIVMI